ncbi:MAG: cob(I)yrinic acid a,c-diamide adenosyltransferase [Patescibacteria group bacterium]
MNKFYTKKGDKGKSFFAGKKFGKASAELEALGELDELASLLGIVKNRPLEADFKKTIAGIQGDLSAISANIADLASGGKYKTPEFPAEKTAKIEQIIENYQKNLKNIKSFIIPGENENSAWFDFARAVCRRAERAVVGLAIKRKIPPEILSYLNRLSSLLFVMARAAAR